MLSLDDVHDILERERLEVEAVGRVIVRGDRLGVAVDHDGLIALGLERVGSMHAAVVELDALANPVRSCREDHDTGLFCLMELRCPSYLIGEVVVARAGSKLACTGIDRLYDRTDSQYLAKGTYDLFLLAREIGNLAVREAHLLCCKHVLCIHAGKATLVDGALCLHDILDAEEEPLIDAGALVQVLDRPATAQRLCNIEDAIRRGARDEVLEVLLVVGRLAVSAEAHMTLLEGAGGLLERFFERGADGHDLAHGLHAGRQGLRGSLELLEGEARDLHDAVVDRRLEAGRGGTGDIIRDLVERIADREERCHLCNREARCLGGKSRGAAHARVHLDDEDTAILRVHGELDVRAAAGNADLFQYGKRVVAQALELVVVQGLAGSHGDGVARVDAHGIEILDGADDDAIAGRVAHDLHLDLFPALDGLLDQDFRLGREG